MDIPEEKDVEILKEFDGQGKQPDKKKKTFLQELLSWVIMLGSAVLIAFFINTFIIVNATVPTGSMRDTIPENTRLVAFRLSYVFGNPQRLDVVVFKSPDGTDTLYVKRIIGMPGETIDIFNGQVFINGSTTPLDEWYLLEEPARMSLINQNFTVPEGAYFVMGDNRNDSRDSRGLGENAWQNIFIPEENLLGRASFTYFPRVSRIR
ncbi:MAG: signal peptidase I [Defluviitaleaceae bacterium]|nr:signal peptidase I [Defluviitaleaceae bacterium]